MTPQAPNNWTLVTRARGGRYFRPVADAPIGSWSDAVDHAQVLGATISDQTVDIWYVHTEATQILIAGHMNARSRDRWVDIKWDATPAYAYPAVEADPVIVYPEVEPADPEFTYPEFDGDPDAIVEAAVEVEPEHDFVAPINTSPEAGDGITNVLAALQLVWADLMAEVDDLPPVTIIVHRSSRAWGHTTVARLWGGQLITDDEPTLVDERHEIMISGENLARGPVRVLGTLLHEAAHVVNLTRGVVDVDSNGRHNKRFKDTAETIFGLDIRDTGRSIGWSDTYVPAATQERYAGAIALLADALRRSTVAHPEKSAGLTWTGGAKGPSVTITRPPTGRRNKNNPRAVCGCPGKSIRAAHSVIESGVQCTVCGDLFTIPTPEVGGSAA